MFSKTYHYDCIKKTAQVVERNFSGEYTINVFLPFINSTADPEFEGLKSVILNYFKERVDEDELDRMVMMVFSLKTVNDGIETK